MTGLKLRKIEETGWFWIDNKIYNGLNCKKRNKAFIISVYGYLAQCANNKTQSCWPTEADISRKTGIGLRKVVSVIGELHRRRMIFVEKLSFAGKKKKNVYYLTHQSLWILNDSASRTHDIVHRVHSNKTHINNKRINRKEIQEKRAALTAKWRLPSSAYLQ